MILHINNENNNKVGKKCFTIFLFDIDMNQSIKGYLMIYFQALYDII